MPKTGPEKKSVRSRQNSRSTSVTTKSVPELTGSIKINEESMCSVLCTLERFVSCLSFRGSEQLRALGTHRGRNYRPKCRQSCRQHSQRHVSVERAKRHRQRGCVRHAQNGSERPWRCPVHRTPRTGFRLVRQSCFSYPHRKSSWRFGPLDCDRREPVLFGYALRVRVKGKLRWRGQFS